MAPTSEILVERLHKNWIDEASLKQTVTAFRALRLFALQDNPESFGSNYAREIEFTEEQWRQRLLSNNAMHVAALRVKDHNTGAKEWLGMVVPIRHDRGTGVEHEYYVLNGMFVRACVRRQGLGRRLIETALDAIKKDRAQRCHGADGADSARVEILVDADNESAISLYRGCGFQFPDSEVGGSKSRERRGIILLPITAGDYA